MSFKVTKITVGKGKTIGDEKANKWERQYFELEAQVEDESGIELAKGSLESLIDTWLKGEAITPRENCASELPPDMSSVPWQKRLGSHGEFDVSNEDLKNPGYVRLLSSLRAHSGKMTVENFFVWILPDGKSIGRKLRAR
jgi:hypothetical protein